MENCPLGATMANMLGGLMHYTTIQVFVELFSYSSNYTITHMAMHNYQQQQQQCPYFSIVNTNSAVTIIHL